ncbi:MAG: acetylxylan esterase [Bryobacterales bacterium]|nr:acetylxylan esterase [Bryobacterales bacterium]
MNRRQFGLAMAGLTTVPPVPVQAPAALREPSYGEQYPDMLLSHLAGKLNRLSEKWDAARAAIRSAAEMENRNRFVRRKFLEMIHGFPPRTPLHPKTVRRLERDGYRVENVIFESRPGFPVTGNLYLPTAGPGPYPGIISPCGHYPLARMQPDYQFVYLNLVRAGFVVLAYDPIGQGERRQYWNPQSGQTESGLSAIYEHSMPGQVLLLLGEDLTHYRIWDGIRAIDYLETRPEVDPRRIGCAGHSGGGTLTLFITPLDERVRCAVVNEGGTGRLWPLRIRPESRIGPSDVEQNLFPAAVHGIDRADLHAAIAPRPLLALIEDFNPNFNEAARQIQTCYRLLGVPDRFATGEATDPHAWTVKLRLATTDWFSRWFYNRPGPEREPEFEPEPPDNLYCTPNGSVRYSRQGETVFSLIVKKGESIPARRAPRDTRELESFRSELTGEIARLLRFRPAEHPLGVRRLVTTPRKGYSIEKLEFLSEPGIYIPAWVFVPEGARGRLPAILWVNDAGKQADGMEFGPLEALARKGRLVVAVDVRGIGDTRPPHTPSIDSPAGFAHLFSVETAMTYMAWFMDESLLGMRVRDVMRSVDYVLSRPDVDPPALRVVGKGRGALWALYAAALDPRIPALICEGGLISYRSLTRTDRYLHSSDVFVRDVLKSFDLPQVAAAVCGRRLALLSLSDPMGRPVDAETAREAYRFTTETFSNAGAAARFRLLPDGFDTALLEV